MLSWFCFFRHDDASKRLSPEDHRGIVALLRACPGLVEGRLYTPAVAEDKYSDDGPGPTAVLQLEFNTVSELEAVLRPHGYLSKLAEPDFLLSLKGAKTEQQGMVTRKYPVYDPVVTTKDGSVCTFLVEYLIETADVNAWHTHYVDNHPQVMAKFPGIRAAEIHTPAVVISALPFAWSKAMQRNKVVFDTPEALTAAMKSPVREEMRADFARFPKFTGENYHFPMYTTIVKGPAAK